MVFRVKRRGLLLIIVWILMLLLALSALSLLEATFNSLPDGHVITSVGWAGYLVTSSFNEQREVVEISASWIVPTLDASAGDGYSSIWIGIGGQQDQTLIQVGTEQDVYSGHASYSAWYELLPAYSTRITNFNVSAGDRIDASIKLVDSATNQWNVQLTDATNGLSFNQFFIYNSTRSSGEWIVERPTINGQISNLAPFGSVVLSECSITVGNEMGGVNNFTYSVVQMTNQAYDRLATTSTLSGTGTGFTVSFNKNS